MNMLVWLAVTFMITFLIGAFIVYCIVGSKFYTDVILVILHKFPESDSQHERASQFRFKHIYPSVSVTGGKIIFGGKVGMTYIGSGNWDSMVVAYLPSREASKETAMRIHSAEAEFRARVVGGCDWN